MSSKIIKPIAIVDYPRHEISSAYGNSKQFKQCIVGDIENEGYVVKNFGELREISDPSEYSGIFLHPGAKNQKETFKFLFKNQEMRAAIIINDIELKIQVSKFSNGKRIWTLPYIVHCMIDFVEKTPKAFALEYKDNLHFVKEDTSFDF